MSSYSVYGAILLLASKSSSTTKSQSGENVRFGALPQELNLWPVSGGFPLDLSRTLYLKDDWFLCTYSHMVEFVRVVEDQVIQTHSLPIVFDEIEKMVGSTLYGISGEVLVEVDLATGMVELYDFGDSCWSLQERQMMPRQTDDIFLRIANEVEAGCEYAIKGQRLAMQVDPQQPKVRGCNVSTKLSLVYRDEQSFAVVNLDNGKETVIQGDLGEFPNYRLDDDCLIIYSDESSRVRIVDLRANKECEEESESWIEYLDIPETTPKQAEIIASQVDTETIIDQTEPEVTADQIEAEITANQTEPEIIVEQVEPVIAQAETMDETNVGEEKQDPLVDKSAMSTSGSFCIIC